MPIEHGVRRRRQRRARVDVQPGLPPAKPVLKPVDPSGGSLTALTCPSVGQCTTVDDRGLELTFDPATGALLAMATVDASSAPTGLACPLATSCTTVDQSGGEATFAPLSSANVRAIAVYNGRVSAQHALGAVACPSAGECVAIDDAGSEVMFDPQSPERRPRSARSTPTATGSTGSRVHGRAAARWSTASAGRSRSIPGPLAARSRSGSTGPATSAPSRAPQRGSAPRLTRPHFGRSRSDWRRPSSSRASPDRQGQCERDQRDRVPISGAVHRGRHLPATGDLQHSLAEDPREQQRSTSTRRWELSHVRRRRCA